MDFWTAVVLIVAIGCFTSMRLKRHAPRPGAEPGDTGELEREVARLRERIAVLERLATDRQRGHDLAREIESLRD
ncbi:hypothetical protein [Novosphingobium colocasiae]|uniref:Phage shock protein B n=1 Tax=Novosphingobium colocasiae TaxID=1256513 RepID=A0A918PML9_9SPHN|nr:hypothetical protein [Novosphingobium colocasiae]GGZ16299.1 hypothetical protein GCM10011614_33860 [Novosphingobium colocasiae]